MIRVTKAFCVWRGGYLFLWFVMMFYKVLSGQWMTCVGKLEMIGYGVLAKPRLTKV